MKKVHAVLSLILCVTLLGGCGLIPEVQLSEEESVLVAEYAAGLLLKYDQQHNNGLMEITSDPIVVETPAPEADAAVTDTTGSDTGTDNSDLVAGMTAEAPELAAALGIPDFLVTYTGYETCDIYPEQEEDELAFSIQARQGYDLLILHFDLTNPGTEAAECDVVTNAPLFRALINQDLRINSQTTILLNDLSVYSGTLEGEETQDTVVVFEIEESVTDQISQIELLLVSDDGDLTYQLQ
ncbi:MAG: hypothetical protein Q4G60_09725 [bacterium]|nr:hypothetical protein [bacterium]